MTFYQAIYDALRPKGDAPEETVLVLQSRAAGRRLLAAVAAQCGLLPGVRAETPYSLAVEACGAELSEAGAPRLMKRRGGGASFVVRL